MNESFNAQILVDKLTHLTNAQLSIETLSHWCIFHRTKAKQVVETWEQQFYHADREKQVSFLYLANDILQNSRRNGMDFIVEFWRVIPDALSEVFNNGSEAERKVAMRLVAIWEDRKVFGSHIQILKEKIKARGITLKEKRNGGELLEKLISSYKDVYNVDEDTLYGKCQVATSFVDKFEKEFANNSHLDSNSESSAVLGELQMQHAALRDSINKLKASELSRTSLIFYLRQALQEQEMKLEEVRNELQAAHSQYEKADVLCKKLGVYEKRQPLANHGLNSSSSVLVDAPPAFVPESSAAHVKAGQAAPAMYSHVGEGEERKPTAAALAAKLAASTSSSQLLSYVFNSLSSNSVVSPTTQEEYLPDDKRLKLENAESSYIPQPFKPPPPPFPHPDTLPQPPPPRAPSPNSSPDVRAPLPLLPASQPPVTPPLLSTTSPFMPPPAGPMTGLPFGYVPPSFTPIQNYPMLAAPPPPFLGTPNSYPGFQVPESGICGQVPPPFSTALPPMSRQ